MNVTSIRYFIQAAEHENFTLASRNLYIAQPNLSKRIAALEKELDVLLFHRENKSVRLTSAGEYFYKECLSILEQLETAISVAQMIQRQEKGIITVGILEGQEFNSIILNNLNSFLEKNPHVELRLERNGFNNLRRGLSTGRYDVIISLGFDYKDASDMEVVIVQSGSIAIAINRENPLALQDSLSIGMLRNEDFVVMSPEESVAAYEGLFQTCGHYDFQPCIVRVAESVEELLLYIESGIGVSILDENTRLASNPKIRIEPQIDMSVDIIACGKRSSANPLVSKLLMEMQGEI